MAKEGRLRLSASARTPCSAASVLWYFFPNDSTKSFFERLFFALNVFPKRIIDKRLIATTAGSMNLFSEPIQNIVVKANRDSGLARRRWNNRSPFSLTKVVLLFHVLS